MTTPAKSLLAAAFLLSSSLFSLGCGSDPKPSPIPENQTTAPGAYAQVNGLNLYYETHGTGRPLIVLHGALSTIDSMQPFIAELAKTRQVIAVELQAHGHTADIDRPLRFETMADDIAALMKHLNIESADVCGYSLGGGVALQVAFRHPRAVRKLVLMSATFKSDAWFPENRAIMATMTGEALAGSPMHEAYLRTAPRPEDFSILVSKISHLLTQEPYDWTQDVAALKTPTLVISGDSDSLPPTHSVEMFGLLGGGKADGMMAGVPTSRLAILPGTTHWDAVTRVDLLVPLIPSFLDEQPASTP
ncbi:alpha/beta fold family hydrolase [Myxococcus stipitatus DSM 14675]|uniref:Alpha/beta fold family hydrolase n=1 Tax=Myxococcus stipitatus (strain DSM 14675 / JCM 12634 / Mx s8) TaxID=1278073 RepID=L7UEL8_MYXSD|nr:alpha/beta hydrolase [Myxococcus stipitatus]AGC46052.1 alpha/beta fold family hydrolase [Myxococcus stipitatus DSM 14675]